MPYFRQDNILFIHIPKTGGTSVEQYFCQKYKMRLDAKSLASNRPTPKYNSSLQHMTYETIINNKDEFKLNMENLTIITIVRNPYSRIISDLFYYKLITVNNSKDEVYNIIKQYVTEYKGNILQYKFVTIDNHNIPRYKFVTIDNHNIPQYKFVTINKELIPNITILRTESLKYDMANIGYTDFNIKINANKNNIDCYDYLNDESIKLINDFYDYDFTLFGYVKIPL